MASFPSATINVRPFEVRVSNEAIDEFKQLLRLSKLGPATVENTTKATPAFGVSRDWVAQTREHWLKTYNWYTPTNTTFHTSLHVANQPDLTRETLGAKSKPA